MKKIIFFSLVIITACAAVGHVVNPDVYGDGSEDLYVRSNPPGADCVLQNDAKEYKLKTPSHVTVKANGDLKINCTYQSTKKSCTLPAYKNWVGDDDPLVYLATFKKTKLKEIESGDAYNNYACFDFDQTANGSDCYDASNKGLPDAGNPSPGSVCDVSIKAAAPELIQDNSGKCLVAGAYCLN